MTMPTIKIHQIYFKTDQRKVLLPEFEPYFNSENKRPAYHEADILMREFEGEIHAKADLTKFVSWKFKKKAQLTGFETLEFIKKNSGYDIYLINPFPLDAYLFRNVWLHGDHCHPGILDFSQKIFDDLNIKIDLKNCIMDPSRVVYCNFWIATPEFWKNFMPFYMKFFEWFETKTSDQEKDFLFRRADKVSKAPYIAFIQERLISTYLYLNPAIKVKAFQYSSEQLEKKYGRYLTPYVMAAESLSKALAQYQSTDLKHAQEVTRELILKYQLFDQRLGWLRPLASWIFDGPKKRRV
jgi:hypothetical protein